MGRQRHFYPQLVEHTGLFLISQEGHLKALKLCKRVLNNWGGQYNLVSRTQWRLSVLFKVLLISSAMQDRELIETPMFDIYGRNIRGLS